MKYTDFRQEKISVFSLGTVQLGRDYGLGEFAVKPAKEEAFRLLDLAVEGGVNMLDTANNYGDSETVIGQWLAKVAPEKRPLIVTKIGPFDHSSEEALRADILAQTQKCMETLGVSVIDMLMAHLYADYKKNPQVLREVFQQLKQEGKIRYSGISVYSEDDYFDVARSGFDAVQIPINVFDQRQIKSGGIQALADAGMAIFARSVYLQGLVFFKPEELDPQMDFCRQPLEQYLQLCKQMDMSPAVLAMSYVLSIPGMSSVVLGCQTVQQAEQNCVMIDQVRQLTTEEMNTLQSAFADIDPRVIDPRKWYNHF